tara:strand:+ start:81 stop:734 length:654 start_codon:yes stop_codon:yes gene_type:complete
MYSKKRKDLPKLREISYKNKKHKYKLNESKKKRRLAIDEGVRNESKKLKVTKKVAAQKKKGRFNILRIYRRNKNKKECEKITDDMKYMDKKYKLGETKNICKTRKNKIQKGGVISKEQASALQQSIKNTTKKEIPLEIIKLISEKVYPTLKENLKSELLNKTERIRDRLDETDEIDDLFEEDSEGWHYKSEMQCMGCEMGIDNDNAHCRACREERGM